MSEVVAPPTIDLSLVTHNSAQWLDVFFVSLIAQNFPLERINILIRDNGSTDNTVPCCVALRERHKSRFGGFAIEGGENIGFGSGHNRNLRNSQAPFFLVSNVDLEFLPGAITSIITMAESDSEDVASWEFRQKPYEHPKPYHPVTLETAWSSSACILFRRSAIERIDGYEERIFMYGEDVELSYRLRDHGYRLRYCPHAVCRHHSYAYAAEYKPLQYLGSTLSNAYIRLRYGSLRQVLSIVPMYIALWLPPLRVPGIGSGLMRNGLSLLRNAPYFLTHRKRSRSTFPIRGWDYLEPRQGAFFPLRELTTNPPLISVVIRTYAGRLGWLREAVTSILNQTYPNIELIVVEDGSSEAQNYLKEVQNTNRLAGITYLSLPKLGRSGIGNAGLRLTRGEFIAFLDDDDLYYADHLETLANELLDNTTLGAAYSLAEQVRTQVISTNPLRYYEARHEVVHAQPFSRPILWHHNYLPIQSVLFRRTLYELYGGFDETLDNLEDWNLWTRYSLNHDFKLIEKTTSLYRIPDNSRDYRQRQIGIDGYYYQAIQRQENMQVTMSPAEFNRYAQELSDNINAVVIPFLRIRNFLVRNQFLTALTFLAARVVGRIRKKRTRTSQQ